MGEYKLVLFMVALMWLLEILNIAFDHQLNQFALIPRHWDKLYGILAMHFLHWNLPHLIANSLPLLILGFFVSVKGRIVSVTISIMLITGVLVWLFARGGVHAGASGLILGYWGYLLSSAFFERNFSNIILAIFTIFIYGGIVFSLLNFHEGISFEGHIFGFIAGVLVAWIGQKKYKGVKNG